jgi:shikimate kinase
MAEATRALLRELPVVFLEVPLADAVKRVGLDAPRPLLAVNPRARWRELMEARRPLYLEVATAVVDTAGRTPEQVADAVLEALELKTPHD